MNVSQSFDNFSLCQVADGDSEEEEDGGDDAGDLPANSNAETVAKVPYHCPINISC